VYQANYAGDTLWLASAGYIELMADGRALQPKIIPMSQPLANIYACIMAHAFEQPAPQHRIS
jgi:hypothetical protein